MISQGKRQTGKCRFLFSLLAACILAGCSQAPSGPTGSTSEVLVQEKHHSPDPLDIRGSNRHHDKEGKQSGGSSELGSKVPEKALTVLKYIEEHQTAPNGYEGGREFHNAGRTGEEGLPKRDPQGRAITYREWDVNPKVPGVNRGPERLVTGSDGSAYFTADHYRTFTKIK